MFIDDGFMDLISSTDSKGSEEICLAVWATVLQTWFSLVDTKTLKVLKGKVQVEPPQVGTGGWDVSGKAAGFRRTSSFRWRFPEDVLHVLVLPESMSFIVTFLQHFILTQPNFLYCFSPSCCLLSFNFLPAFFLSFSPPSFLSSSREALILPKSLVLSVKGRKNDQIIN